MARIVRSRYCAVGLLLASGILATCAPATTRRIELREGTILRGQAAWYGGRWHGRQTASGVPLDRRAMTAAHATLPFGTIVRVTNLANQRSVRVQINDRGPAATGKRIIDVSEAAARRLGMLRQGIVPVTVEIIRIPQQR